MRAGGAGRLRGPAQGQGPRARPRLGDGGLAGWSYPYQSILIDERQGQVVGFWKQLADARRPDGSPYEVPGIGGSRFRYGGGFRWSRQRDWLPLW
ncbi:hypothetical protein [Nonomuraea rubra]|uniref:hypothetical protein n=1 Tax=Nonomuraea rubra TaxID=46180 RepID=UPI0031EE93F8